MEEEIRAAYLSEPKANRTRIRRSYAATGKILAGQSMYETLTVREDEDFYTGQKPLPHILNHRVIEDEVLYLNPQHCPAPCQCFMADIIFVNPRFRIDRSTQ